MPTLIQLREKAKKPRAQVAYELGISEKTLYRLEHGKSPVKPTYLHAFASYYGVPVRKITANGGRRK